MVLNLFRKVFAILNDQSFPYIAYFCLMTNPKDITKVYFAPLQEFTGIIYRNAHYKYFGGVDKYFTPYINLQNDGSIKKAQQNDVAFSSNKVPYLVPQVLAANATEFLKLANHLTNQGYREINWNMGCPYPMATRKNRGAGLLPHPDEIRSILDSVLPKTEAVVTVKLRSGLTNDREIFEVMSVLEQFPIPEVILHPRIASQLYKGTADRTLFEEVRQAAKLPLIYNGDICTTDNLAACKQQFPEPDTWMIGRGILQDPFLPRKIKGEPAISAEERFKILGTFHDEIFYQTEEMMQGNSHLLMKMVKFWSYFCHQFPNPHKTFKRIKKARKIEKYNQAVRENFQSLRI